MTDDKIIEILKQHNAMDAPVDVCRELIFEETGYLIGRDRIKRLQEVGNDKD